MLDGEDPYQPKGLDQIPADERAGFKVIVIGGGMSGLLFGDRHVHGTEGVSFYTQAKVVTSRWPQPLEASGAHLSFPTAH
jgi:hypothetical protein